MTEKEHEIYRQALDDMDSLRKAVSEQKQQYKDLQPYTCTDINCKNRKKCRIKNGVFVTTPELNVRMKALDKDGKVQFIPIKECVNKTEVFITAFDIMKAHKWQNVEVYIDDKKIATIYG